MGITCETPSGTRSGHLEDAMEDAMREDVCEHCAFSFFDVSGPAGQCRANPPQVVLVPQQQRDIATGQMVFVPAVQSVFPPVERRSHCYTFEPREDIIGEH